VLLKYRLTSMEKLLAAPQRCAAPAEVAEPALRAAHEDVDEVVPAF
jgi:hypothetical protein